MVLYLWQQKSTQLRHWSGSENGGERFISESESVCGGWGGRSVNTGQQNRCFFSKRWNISKQKSFASSPLLKVHDPERVCLWGVGVGYPAPLYSGLDLSEYLGHQGARDITKIRPSRQFILSARYIIRLSQKHQLFFKCRTILSKTLKNIIVFVMQVF